LQPESTMSSLYRQCICKRDPKASQQCNAQDCKGEVAGSPGLGYLYCHECVRATPDTLPLTRQRPSGLLEPTYPFFARD
jgi:hypothetical protein